MIYCKLFIYLCTVKYLTMLNQNSYQMKTNTHETTVNIKGAVHHDLSQCIPQQDKYITSIIVSSPGSLIESYMEIGFSLKGGATSYIKPTDYLLNPSVSVINLTEHPVVIQPNLIITFDSKSDANLFITFVSKDDLEERLEMLSCLLKAYSIIHREKHS